MHKFYSLAVMLFTMSSLYAQTPSDESSRQVLQSVSAMGYISSLIYNNSGQLVQIINPDQSSITLDYTPVTVNGKTYNVTMTENEYDETITSYFVLNSDGNATSCYTIDKEVGEPVEYIDWTFEYNNDGQLTKVTKTENNVVETTNITYSDGNITSVKEGYNTTTIQYTSNTQINPIPNVAAMMMYDDFFDIDVSEIEAAYFAGILGKPTASLPLRKTESIDEYTDFTWVIDEAGYPTSVTIKDNDDYDSLKLIFTWTAAAGINTVMNEEDSTPQDYFDLNGRRMANPEHGLYIARYPNGTTTKIIRR